MNFDTDWALAASEAALIHTLGAGSREIQQHALSWVKQQSRDMARNWLAEIAMAYLREVSAGRDPSLEVKDAIESSISYGGNWINHLMALQLLIYPERSADEQWRFIERGVLDYLSCCNKDKVSGVMMGALLCGEGYKGKGVVFCTQNLLLQACEALNSRSAHVTTARKASALAIFKHHNFWPSAVTPEHQSFYVSETARFIQERPEQVQFLKKLGPSELKKLHTIYDSATLAPFLNSRQLESRLSEDLGL